MTVTGHPGFDLDDPTLLFREDVLADPRPLWAELRRRAPVWKLPDQDTYLVSDPAVIRDVVARPEDFSSNLVSMIHRGCGGAVVPFGLLPYRDPNHVLAVADPPDHTRHRKVLQAQLTPAAVAGLEPAVRRLCADGLAPLVEAGSGDAVALLADPVPTAMICELLGLPASEAEELVPLVLGVGELLDGLADDEGIVRAGGAALALASHASATIDGQRSCSPRDRSPLMDAVLTAIDDLTITHDEAVGMLMQLFTAGTETTQSLAATVIESLAQDPRAQSELRRDPDGVPEALEDALRADGPFQFHYRWATCDTTLGVAEVPAGSRVLLLWSAANQVAGVQDPEQRQAPHWSFGRGIHFCIGAALARLEARVMIEELLARTGEFRLDPDHPPERRPSIMLRRHSSLPILVTASPHGGSCQGAGDSIRSDPTRGALA